MPAEIAAALPRLRTKAIATLAARTPCPVATYRTILKSVGEVDLRSGDAEVVRRRFNSFYGVRRNAEWRATFYASFEAAKASQLPPAGLFAKIVQAIHADTGRVEASFVSKLVATVNPQAPIIDSVVRKWFSTVVEPPEFSGDVEVVVGYYRWLEGVMTEAAATGAGKLWSDEFEAQFPTPTGERPITPVKRLDFLIWAGADR